MSTAQARLQFASEVNKTPQTELLLLHCSPCHRLGEFPDARLHTSILAGIEGWSWTTTAVSQGLLCSDVHATVQRQVGFPSHGFLSRASKGANK
jgi:hypothetical protein